MTLRGRSDGITARRGSCESGHGQSTAPPGAARRTRGLRGARIIGVPFARAAPGDLVWQRFYNGTGNGEDVFTAWRRRPTAGCTQAATRRQAAWTS